MMMRLGIASIFTATWKKQTTNLSRDFWCLKAGFCLRLFQFGFAFCIILICLLSCVEGLFSLGSVLYFQSLVFSFVLFCSRLLVGFRTCHLFKSFFSNQNIRECIIVGFGLVVWIPGILYERDCYLPPRMSFCHILPT